MSDPADANKSSPDAFIFLPGLVGPIDQSGLGIAKRLAQALARQAQTGEAKFSVAPEVQEKGFGGDQEKPLKTKCFSINRKDGAAETKVMDLYELDYRPLLGKKYKDQNIFRKILPLLWIIPENILRFFKAFFRKDQGKKAREKIQFLFSTMILALSLVYCISLVISAYQASNVASVVIQSPTSGRPGSANIDASPGTPATAANPAATQIKKIPGATTEPNKEPLPAATRSFGSTWALWVVILVAFLELFYPDLKQGWSDMAVQYLAAMEYLEPGTNKAAIGGQLTELVEYLTKKQDYRHINLLCFSFGTLIALDNIFPAGRLPSPRFAKLHTIITIGCPYDLICLYWPQYFYKRFGLPNTPQKWLNVYSRNDILASNFRNDDKIGQAENLMEFSEELNLPPLAPENIHYSASQIPEQLKTIHYLNPFILQTHSMYWNQQFESELTCFGPIITRMYQDDPILK